MAGGQFSPVQIVVRDHWQSTVCQVAHGQDNRCASVGNLCENIDVAPPGGASDDGVDASAQESGEESFKACVIIQCFDDERHHASGFEALRDPSQHGCDIGIRQV